MDKMGVSASQAALQHITDIDSDIHLSAVLDHPVFARVKPAPTQRALQKALQDSSLGLCEVSIRFRQGPYFGFKSDARNSCRKMPTMFETHIEEATTPRSPPSKSSMLVQSTS